MATQRIIFGEWLPDQAGLSGALTNAKNVVSQAIGYGPLPSAVNFSQSASENLQAIFAGKQPDGVVKLFASGRTKIYSVSGVGALTDVSGTTYTTSATERFRFTQFGDVILATNNSEKVQAWTLGSSYAFANLSATAPVAKYITVVRDFVVVANVYEGSAQNVYRVRWSALNDETDWTVSQATQSDYQDLADGGQIMGIRGGEFGIVLLERSIVRMSYIGTPFVFQFDNISRGKGCSVSGSIAQYQGLTFFLSEDGFYVCDGQSVQSIGGEKVDRWFLNDASENDYPSMSAAIDPARKLVIWSYKDKFAVGKLIIYNFMTKKWTYGVSQADYISDASTASSTLEELDSLSSSIDSLGTPFDSSLFAGGRYFLGGTSGTKVITYTGQPMGGVIETGDIQAGTSSMISLARPQIDNGSANVSVVSRRLLNEVVDFSTQTPVAADSENRAGIRSLGQYHRIRVEPTGNWKTTIAVDIDIAQAGNR